MIEYIIVGDTERFNGCLVKVLSGVDEDGAKKILERMLTNPNEHDLRSMKGHKNLRIKAVEAKDQWWNDPFLAN